MNGKPWLPEDLQKLRAMRADGRPKEEVARALGRTLAALESKLNVLRRAARSDPNANPIDIASTKKRPGHGMRVSPALGAFLRKPPT